MVGEVEEQTEEDVINFVELASSSFWATYATEIFDKLQESMHPVCSVHNIYFHDQVQQHELFYGYFLVDNFNSISTDPLYSVLLFLQDDNFSHRFLGTNDLVDVVKFWNSLIKPGYQGHIFCSTPQFRLWIRALAEEAWNIVTSPIARTTSFKTKEKCAVSLFLIWNGSLFIITKR